MHFGHASHVMHPVNTTKLEDCENPDIHDPELQPYHNEDVCHFFNDHDADGSGALSVDEAVDGIIAELEPHLEAHVEYWVNTHGSEGEGVDDDGNPVMEISYEEFLKGIKHEEEQYQAESE